MLLESINQPGRLSLATLNLTYMTVLYTRMERRVDKKS